MPFVGLGVGIGRQRFGVGGGFVGLLDTYSGAAAAYSLRQLSSTYSGDAIRVRRSSDNTETNIGFVNNELDTSTLATFCSGTNGFVTTWYDQSGNGYDATQTTAASQPKIYDSVSGVITQNGKPTLDFGTISQNISIGIGSLFLTNNLITTVHNVTYKSSKNQVMFALSDSNVIMISSADAGKLKYVNSNDNLISTTNVGLFQLCTIDINDEKLYINDIEEDNQTTVSGSTDRYWIGNYTDTSGNQLEGYVSEIVVWQTVQTSNISNINNNINDFYNIY